MTIKKLGETVAKAAPPPRAPQVIRPSACMRTASFASSRTDADIGRAVARSPTSLPRRVCCCSVEPLLLWRSNMGFASSFMLWQRKMFDAECCIEFAGQLPVGTCFNAQCRQQPSVVCHAGPSA